MMKNTFSSGNIRWFLAKIEQSNLSSFSIFKIIFLSLIIGTAACTGKKTPPAWNGIIVNVKADHAVVTEQKASEKYGFQLLDITLSNQGTEIATIDNIEIRIPIPENISHDMEIGRAHV